MFARFGQQLRQWRQQAGYDLTALASFGPMTAAHLERIEEGAAPDMMQLLHPLGYTLGRACRMAGSAGATPAGPDPAAAESLRAMAVELAGALADGAGQAYLAGFQLGWGSPRRPL